MFSQNQITENVVYVLDSLCFMVAGGLWRRDGMEAFECVVASRLSPWMEGMTMDEFRERMNAHPEWREQWTGEVSRRGPKRKLVKKAVISLGAQKEPDEKICEKVVDDQMDMPIVGASD